MAVLNYAYGCTSSLSSFRDHLSPITHLSSICYLIQVALAPPGTQACTFDIEKFHRTCSVLPDHKPWLVVQGKPGEFFIDHTHPFGAACASSNAGMIANAIVDIWKAEGIDPILKYEDDIAVFRTPISEGQHSEGSFRYAYDRSDALKVIAPLKIPWHPNKGMKLFASLLVFLGLLWDLNNRRVSLPENKRLKFLSRVNSFIAQFSQRRCSLRDIEKLHGSLCYLSFVYPDGRSRLPSLSNFSTKFNGNGYIRLYPPHSLITDLKWWFAKLSEIGNFRQLSPRGPVLDMGIFVDASTSWGIGIVIDQRWKGFQLAPDWKIPGRDITWLETLAIEILFGIIASSGISNRNLLIHSDNQGTIGAMAKGRSPNFHINLSVRRTYTILSSILVVPTIIYIPSADNPADPSHAERWVLPP
jgi:hypothetical protein